MSDKLTATKIKSFNAAIGRFILEWAGLELGIDLLVIILARALGSKEFPHEISKKLNRLAGNAGQLNLPTARLRQLLSLIKEIKSLVPIRHDYIHGTIIDRVVNKSKLTVTFGRLLQPNSDRRMPVRVTEEHLEEMSDRFHQIGDALLDLAEIANDASPTKKL
jgi:hypothetical protein